MTRALCLLATRLLHPLPWVAFAILLYVIAGFARIRAGEVVLI